MNHNNKENLQQVADNIKFLHNTAEYLDKSQKDDFYQNSLLEIQNSCTASLENTDEIPALDQELTNAIIEKFQEVTHDKHDFQNLNVKLNEYKRKIEALRRNLFYHDSYSKEVDKIKFKYDLGIEINPYNLLDSLKNIYNNERSVYLKETPDEQCSNYLSEKIIDFYNLIDSHSNLKEIIAEYSRQIQEINKVKQESTEIKAYANENGIKIREDMLALYNDIKLGFGPAVLQGPARDIYISDIAKLNPNSSKTKISLDYDKIILYDEDLNYLQSFKKVESTLQSRLKDLQENYGLCSGIERAMKRTNKLKEINLFNISKSPSSKPINSQLNTLENDNKFLNELEKLCNQEDEAYEKIDDEYKEEIIHQFQSEKFHSEAELNDLKTKYLQVLKEYKKRIKYRENSFDRELFKMKSKSLLGFQVQTKDVIKYIKEQEENIGYEKIDYQKPVSQLIEEYYEEENIVKIYNYGSVK